MKKYFSVAMFTIFTFFILYSPGIGQDQTPSVDPEREIIVMFTGDAVTLPAGKTKGNLEEFDIPSQALKNILKNREVKNLSRLMPDFRPGDQSVFSRTGEKTELTDWTNVYVLLLPSAKACKGIITALENRGRKLFMLNPMAGGSLILHLTILISIFNGR